MKTSAFLARRPLLFAQPAPTLPTSGANDNPHLESDGVKSRRWNLIFWVAVLAAAGESKLIAENPPVLLWTTNVGARLFAVDSQTNVYANSGGSVIVLSGAGMPLRTNQICPVSDCLAQRDADGNYYFAGAFTPPTDFGGVTLTNGSGFLAKYTSTGSLIWAVSLFLPSGYGSTSVEDLRLDPVGAAYVGYWVRYTSFLHSGPLMTRITASGNTDWAVYTPGGPTSNDGGGAEVRFGALTATNGYVLSYVGPFGPTALGRFTSTGTGTNLGAWGYSWTGLDSARPVGNSSEEVYTCENGSGNNFLEKRDSCGDILWSQLIGQGATVGEDEFGGVHVSSGPSQLSRYDYDGNLVWTTTLPAYCMEMVLDPAGNRFVWMQGGGLGRLGAETLSAPAIVRDPQGQTALAGSDVSLSVEATGSGPLRYFWRFNDAPLSGGSSAELRLSGVSEAQAGLYSVTVSNFLGSVSSSSALLRVKSVALFEGSQLLTNGTYVFAAPPTLSIRHAFTNGIAFYTLDGSTPSFASTLYTGPFEVPYSTTVRAIAYSADFLQSEEADAVTAVVAVNYRLSISASGGGTLTLDPPGGTYSSGSIVTVTAAAPPGWTFLGWLGDTNGASNPVSVLMEHDKTLRAVFGTTLTTTVAGAGQVLLDPPGGSYAYGSVVRLTGVPDPGNYFGFWGNAAVGNTNPLYFTVAVANPTVSAIFAATPAGQAALTVQVQGGGRVNASPRANAYDLGQVVTLTAQPDAGQSFLGWSGDASGTQNPLLITLDKSRTVTALFTSRPILSAARQGLEGLTANGFRFTLSGTPQMSWRIQGSTNLGLWEDLGNVTNSLGEVQFTDPGAASLHHRFYRAVGDGN